MSASSAGGMTEAPGPRRIAQLGRLWRRYRWVVLSAAAFAGFVLAFIAGTDGFLGRFQAALHLLPVAPAETEGLSVTAKIARILVTLVLAYITYRAVFTLFGERVQEIRAGLARRHTVVYGLGRQGQAVVESLLGKTKVVAIELNPANPSVRRFRDAGAVVLVGDATDPELARKARVSRASHVVATCGQDAINAQIGASVLELTDREAPGPDDAFVHISDPRLYTFLLHHSFSGRGSRLEFFNLYERGARVLLNEANMSDAPPSVALVVGAGQLGLALVSRLAREHQELEAGPTRRSRLRIHLVDREAHARIQVLVDRFSRMREICDLVPHVLDVGLPDFDHFLHRVGPEDVDVGFVCFDDDPRTIAVTLNLLDQAHGRFPIVARVTQRSGGIVRMITAAQSRYADVGVFRPVGLAERAADGAVVLEGMRGQLAREVHSLYRRTGQGGPYDVPWESLPEEGRQRNLRHANSIASQLEAVGYRLGPLIDWGRSPPTLAPEDVERMAELEHDRWLSDRLEEGWSYGPVRDDDARQHPDIVPWQDLSDERREINRRLVRGRPVMLARVGIQIYRG